LVCLLWESSGHTSHVCDAAPARRTIPGCGSGRGCRRGRPLADGGWRRTDACREPGLATGRRHHCAGRGCHLPEPARTRCHTPAHGCSGARHARRHAAPTGQDIMTDETLMRLAEAAGVAAQWEDAAGNPKTVEPDVLRHVLGALGLPAQNDREAKESLATLKREQQTCPPLVTAIVGQPVRIPGSHAGDSGFELRVESGKKTTGTARRGADGTLELPA